MAFSDVSSQSFMTELMSLSKSIIWKNQFLAIEHEPDDNRIEVETYIAARNDTLTFKDVFQFHESVLRQVLPPNLVMEATYRKRSIPEEYRDMLVELEKQVVIDEWENQNGERNAYYRMLFGLPPLEAGESAYAYNTAYADIDMTTPIHLLDYTDRLKLEKRDYIDQLLSMEENKDKKYLKYVGKYRIYPYIARQAERYEIIYLEPSQYEYLRNDFADTYEKCRRLIVRVYYTDAYKNSTNVYEGFIGMCILFMTQQQMFAKYLQADITRNFYDLESLKLVYDAYSVLFYPSIPLKYHERIVKCINELISYKGSTQVFYDMFDLFDFGRMDVFEYYLVKQRITDENGNPVFLGPDKKTPLSPEEMYRIGFARVGYKDDKYIEITNPENYVEYEVLTSEDPYWEEDLDLRKKLYEEDWNYLHSKYIGVQVMFDLSKLLFESTYFMKLLSDNRESLSQLTTYYINTGSDVPIFDLCIYAFALLCKDFGYAGEIPSDPSSIAKVYGYNFKEHNYILKMATDSMDNFVKRFKEMLMTYVTNNEMLSTDDALIYYISKITDGAFTYTGDDFPYGEWGYAPPPVFLHDFTPTYNSVTTVRKYLKETIELLQSSDDETDYELMMLYNQYVVDGDKVFKVSIVDGYGIDTHYQRFLLKKEGVQEGDPEELRKALIASYTNLLNWMNTLLEARRSLTLDPHILEIIKDMDIEDVSDIDRVYENIMELDEYLTIKIRTSIRREDYTAFANIRKILMTTYQINETYTKRNGQVAKTFEDLLEDINPELHSRMYGEDFDASTEFSYVIQTLMRLCDDLELLEAMNTKNLEKTIRYLLSLLKFLKSAKVDLTKFQIIYILNSRSMNYIKFLCEIHSQYVTYLHVDDEIHLKFKVWWMYVTQYIHSTLRIHDEMDMTKVYHYIKDAFIYLTDDIKQVNEYNIGSAINWFDFMASAYSIFTAREPLILQEELAVEMEETPNRTRASSLNMSDKLLERDPSSGEPSERSGQFRSGLVLDAKKNHSVFEYGIPDFMLSIIDKINYHTISDRYVGSSLHWKDSLIEVEKINLDSSITS